MADSKKPHSLHSCRLQRLCPHLSCSSTLPLADRRSAFAGSAQWGVDGLLASVLLPLSLTRSPLPPPLGPSQTSTSLQSLQAPPADASIARDAAARPMAAAARAAAPTAAAVTAQAGSMAVKG